MYEAKRNGRNRISGPVLVTPPHPEAIGAAARAAT